MKTDSKMITAIVRQKWADVINGVWNITTFGMTDVGLKRKNNEDAFWINRSKDVFVVLDGMGGHNAGEVASKMAMELLKASLSDEALRNVRKETESIKNLFFNAMTNASAKILLAGSENADYAGMGCAAVVAWRNGNMVHTSHVGDARIYVCDKERVAQLGCDHSYIAEVVKQGRMTKEEARQSRLKKNLTQALGMADPVEPEYQEVALHSGDRIVLCSDGLWDMVPESEMHHLVMSSDNAKTACEELLKRAKKAGGNDNITVVVSIYRHPKGHMPLPFLGLKSCPSSKSHPHAKSVLSKINSNE